MNSGGFGKMNLLLSLEKIILGGTPVSHYIIGDFKTE